MNKSGVFNSMLDSKGSNGLYRLAPRTGISFITGSVQVVDIITPSSRTMSDEPRFSEGPTFGDCKKGS